jgi:2-polyprenyl-3-methyl-5-hydroxy-6-metoxy-1,4-benzoquinol methylase
LPARFAPRRTVADGRRQSVAYEDRRLRLIADRARGEVLDVGYAQLPNPYLRGASTTGIDLEPASTPSGYREELVGSATDLATVLGGQRFDTVVAAEIIEHVEDPYAFLRGLRQGLQPGGRLVLSTPNPLGFPVLLLEAMRSRRWFYTEDHTHYFLPRWVERMLDRTGFLLTEVRPVGIWLPIGCIPWSPVWASYQLIYVAEAVGLADER